jgi:hypothetical protein
MAHCVTSQREIYPLDIRHTNFSRLVLVQSRIPSCSDASD